jgi:acetolactate synthase-1/2/3 large subunit
MKSLVERFRSVISALKTGRNSNAANRIYAILENEMRNVGILKYGENARRMLRFDNPPLDWISLARGHGVEGRRAETGKALADALRASFKRTGPFAIEAVI